MFFFIAIGSVIVATTLAYRGIGRGTDKKQKELDREIDNEL